VEPELAQMLSVDAVSPALEIRLIYRDGDNVVAQVTINTYPCITISACYDHAACKNLASLDVMFGMY
jgi:MOSC domain-containing protein YiiM